MGVQVTRDEDKRDSKRSSDDSKDEDEIDLTVPEAINIDDPVRMYL